MMVVTGPTHGSLQTTRTLRIFLSHTVSGQVWQTGEAAAAATEGGDAAVNFETRQGIPAWAIKIEGRLLEVRIVCTFVRTFQVQLILLQLQNQRAKDKVTPRKFSTFVKRMIVELDRDTTLYPDGNIVEVSHEYFLYVGLP